MKKIYINTTNNKEVIVRLTIDGKKFEEKFEVTHRTQPVLPLIEKLLKEHNLTPQDLEAIEVNPGPGSFTGVRVGVAVANALAFSLGIPVNGIQTEKDKPLVEPVYE